LDLKIEDQGTKEEIVELEGERERSLWICILEVIKTYILGEIAQYWQTLYEDQLNRIKDEEHNKGDCKVGSHVSLPVLDVHESVDNEVEQEDRSKNVGLIERDVKAVKDDQLIEVDKERFLDLAK
jgi:hypothetical protein